MYSETDRPFKTAVDITMTATLRPELVERTLTSAIAMLNTTKCHFRLVLNIDQVPKTSVFKADDVWKAATRHIPVDSCMIPDKPSFALAVKSNWSRTTAQYVLNLEDDWDFVRKIDFDWCIAALEAGAADQIRFNTRRFPKTSEMQIAGLSPGLWLGSMVRAIAELLVGDFDPEKQIHYGLMGSEMDAVLPRKIIDYPGGLSVRDTGRDWRDAHNIQKWDKNTRHREVVWS